MIFDRGTGIQGKELQLLIEATEDRIFGAPQIDSNLSSNDCLPTDARCGAGGQSSLPGFRALLIRSIQRAVAEAEHRTRLAFYPRRKTNLAKSPEEVYSNRVKFGTGALDSFLTPQSRDYPAWTDLNVEQQGFYNNDSNLYTPGSLPWDLLTTDQKDLFSKQVLYVPNKVEDEERLDGKARSLIKLYERNVIKIHKMALEIQDPQGLGIPYLNRTYAPNEYFLYKKPGQVILFPAQAKMSATGASQMVASSGYGLVVPSMPQIVTVDYEFGLEELPFDLQDAVALLAANRAFEDINIAYTKGMLNYSVQGFSAAFGEGMYSKVMERYAQKADDLLAPYFQLVMAAQ